jgi:hypothetical protein
MVLCQFLVTLRDIDILLHEVGLSLFFIWMLKSTKVSMFIPDINMTAIAVRRFRYNYGAGCIYSVQNKHL